MSDYAHGPGPARRRDARENRWKILAAARSAFDALGADASMAEIARRAAIGQATLYRNFPDRTALLQALYSDEIDDMAGAAVTIEGGTDLARLQNWLRRFAEYFTSKQALAGELLKAAGPDSAVFSSGYARMTAAATPLVDAAHRSGQLRGDLALDHVVALIVAVAGIRGEAAFRAPLLELALDALATDRVAG